MQILGLLGIYFDAVVVEVEKQIFTFFQIGPGHTVCRFFLARTIEKLLTTLEILSLYMACVLQGAELRINKTEKAFNHTLQEQLF